ncbi:hypothetical protein HN51_008002 [Arachis hypogaea]
MDNLIAHVEERIVNLEKLLNKKSIQEELRKKTTEVAAREMEASSTKNIVLATNFAESIITIDGVVYVIDCGKTNGTSYDALNKLACLLSSTISKALAHQVLPCTRFGCAIIRDISGV